MRRIFVGVMVGCLVASAAWAGPKDKSKETLIDSTSIIGNNTTWNNNTVQAGVKSGKCKIKIQFKDTLPGIEGDQIMCFGCADVRATSLPGGDANSYGNCAVLLGTVTDGQLKMKADLSQVGCGVTSAAVAFNPSMTCYNEDLLYDFSAKCFAEPGGALPLLGDGSDDLVGVCQGAQANTGQRLDAPANGVLAVSGSSQPLAP